MSRFWSLCTVVACFTVMAVHADVDPDFQTYLNTIHGGAPAAPKAADAHAWLFGTAEPEYKALIGAPAYARVAGAVKTAAATGYTACNHVKLSKAVAKCQPFAGQVNALATAVYTVERNGMVAATRNYAYVHDPVNAATLNPAQVKQKAEDEARLARIRRQHVKVHARAITKLRNPLGTHIGKTWIRGVLSSAEFTQLLTGLQNAVPAGKLRPAGMYVGVRGSAVGDGKKYRMNDAGTALEVRGSFRQGTGHTDNKADDSSDLDFFITSAYLVGLAKNSAVRAPNFANKMRNSGSNNLLDFLNRDLANRRTGRAFTLVEKNQAAQCAINILAWSNACVALIGRKCDVNLSDLNTIGTVADGGRWEDHPAAVL